MRQDLACPAISNRMCPTSHSKSETRMLESPGITPFCGRQLLLMLLGQLLLIPGQATAWGYEGHSQVGRLASTALDETAAQSLQEILQTDDPVALDEACNWPDAVRETPEWEWSAPQHYINIPRSASRYDRERDCPTGLCVTEAIKKYADELSDPKMSPRRHWEALSWLCHLVGDLHQPLHAGYRDDRGGNRVEIEFNGEEADLHEFWDRLLIQYRLELDGGWTEFMTSPVEQHSGRTWNPLETDGWTSESHLLVAEVAYPAQPRIEAEFAERNWVIIQAQLRLAAYRLAWILNATIGEGEVTVSPESRVAHDGTRSSATF